MRKGIKILLVITLVILAIQPITQSLIISKNSEPKKIIDNETIKTVCMIISPDKTCEKIVKQVSRENYNKIIEMGRSLHGDFLTIYNPYSTDVEVNAAFENVRPFFIEIVDNELTDKPVEDLECLYRDIRDKIIEEKEHKGGNKQPTGWWNGIWAPMFMNGGCGIFSEAKRCQGFVIGTHSILPTIGFDILLTYFTTDLSAMTGTIGVTGATDANGPQMAFIINYLGILFGEIPVISYMVFALLIGYAMFYVGASLY